EFWHREQELVRTEVLPYQWNALNDKVEGAAPSYCMHNFRAAGKLMKEKKSKGKEFTPPTYTFRGFEALPDDPEHPEEDKFYGFVFQDTDFSKWIEAVGYSLTIHPDAELEKTADDAIDVVCAAQLENGYLDTYYIINGMDRAFTNLRDHHELYCLGHLVEGAISYYQATGKDKLLNAAKRFADYCADYFGPEEDKCKGYPGHEIAEMALAKLYEVTGEEKYLKLAEFFIDERGKAPNYFEQEEEKRAKLDGVPYHKFILKPDANWFDRNRYWYHQAHIPVRKQSEAVGHAVRGVYLYSGMADVARLSDDEELYEACKRLWNNIVTEKLYVTGGIGGSHMGESFSFPFDLPNDTAYSETCAAIGLVFFARRMLQISAESKYSDVMELALYNTVLAGMALDGKSFFYVNPLEVFPTACDRDERKLHVKAVRQKWFGCACCPPNIARLVSSLGAYAYTQNEDTLWTHLYMSGVASKDTSQGKLVMETASELPWSGKVKVKVSGEVKQTLAFRIPGWSDSSDIKWTCNGEENIIHISKDQVASGDTSKAVIENGYIYLEGVWDNDEIDLSFEMNVRIVRSNNNVRENVGKVAVMRGPITYCLEEIDNGKNLHLVHLDVVKAQEAKDCVSFTNELGHNMAVIKLPGFKEKIEDDANLYKYASSSINMENAELRFVPYYSWNNRGIGEMTVWVRN
nr:glycoside hydrolase family 127 protein [Butyrivibrio sp.]